MKWLGQEAVCATCADKSSKRRKTLAGSYHRDRTK